MNGLVFLNINDFVVAWEVYCGRMISVDLSSSEGQTPLSSWIASVIKKKGINWLHNELIMESIRQEYFPSKISRLRGMYFFEDKKTAISASKEWKDGHFNLDYLAEVEFLSESSTTKVDHNWIVEKMNNRIDPDNRSDTEWIHKYWKGEKSNRSPLWELLVKGRAVVLGSELRKKAYETIQSKQLGTLGLLEVSRVAWGFGSHLGHIAAWLVKDPSNSYLEIKYAYDFRDANDEKFLEKFEKYQGAKNTKDLNAHTELVSPDLRNEFLKFNISDEGILYF